MSVNPVTHVGEIGWPGFSFFDPTSWIPTYGMWGGPGWAGGKRVGDNDSQIDWTIPPCTNGYGQPSQVDLACYYHDLAYFQAKGDAALILQADLKLLQDLANINPSQMDGTEQTYASLAAVAFAAKISLYDVPIAGLEQLKNSAADLLQIIQNKLGMDNKTYTDEFGNTLTVSILPDGSRVISGTNSDNSSYTSSYDANSRITSSHVTERDSANNITSTNSSTYSYDANGNLQSVNSIQRDANGNSIGTDECKYAYDANGKQLSSTETITNANGSTESYNSNYDSNGNITSYSESKTNADSSSKTWTGAYDAKGNLVSSTETYANADGSTYSFSEIYDKDSNQTTVTETQTGADGHVTFTDTYVVPGPIDNGGPDSDGEENLNNARELFNQSSQVISPVILDLDRDGVETTGLTNGVHFDHDDNGFAEQTSWVSSDDGILVMDRNGNGIIDNGTELFGNETLLQNGQKAANGFQALAELDGNSDGKIDADDAAYTQLLIWKDINGDGYSSHNELFTLNELGIQSINTSYYDSSYIDANGNEYKQVGSFTRTDNSRGTAADVWFQTDKMHTIANEWLDVPADIAALPNLQGYGNVYDLRQAMARDASGQLKSLVEQFVAAQDVTTRESILNQILFKWTGSDGITQGSNGYYIDARKVGVLEKVFGQAYVGTWGPTEAGPNSASLLSQAYDVLYETCYAQLMSQTHLKYLYDSITYHLDEATNTRMGNLTAVAKLLRSQIAADHDTGMENLTEFTRSLRGLNATEIMNFSDFCNEVAAGDQSIFDQAYYGGQVLYGTSGNDTLMGTSGNDSLIGGAGDDYLYGGYGGTDVFDGGAGNDTCIGGMGADTYRFGIGDGHDVIFDSLGIDTIIFGNGITADSLEFRLSTIQYDNGIIISIKETGDSIRIGNWFADTWYQIEHFKFADGSEMTASEVNARAIAGGFVGTDESEELWAPDYLGTNLYGNGGDDTLHGSNYDDTIDGGSGNDIMYGGTGNDTYMWGRGSGQDIISDSYGNLDKIILGSDILPADVSLARTGEDIILSINGTSDTLTLSGWGSYQGMIEQIIFADGTIWNEAIIKQNLLTSTDGNDTIIGFSSDDTLNGGMGADTLIGGAGNDTYIVDNAGDLVTENTDEGTDLIQSSISYTLGANIENLTLTGTNAITGTGNSLANIITGNDAGSTLTGGLGNDTYVVYNPDTIIVENVNEGNDVVQSYAANYTLSNDIEALTLMGDAAINGAGNGMNNILGGNSAANSIQGGAGNDSISGGAGNDSLDGGAGDDTLMGGTGNDTYIFNQGDGHDTIFEDDSTVGNVDTIRFGAGIAPADITFTRDGFDLILGIKNTSDQVTIQNWGAMWTCRIERFEFAEGTIWDSAQIQAQIPVLAGTENNDTLYAWDGVAQGLGGNDILYGSMGNDTLDGGTGADTLKGGIGNDTYVVDDVGDVVTEYWGEGTDTVQSYISYTLGSQIENLTLLGSAAITGKGNELDNIITGNDAGSTLAGGLGNDTYVINSLSDVIIENAGEGIDTVQSSISYTLADNNLENLTLSGTEAINGTGNTFNNVITGNSANNILDGGAGEDTMMGGTGDDTYIVDNIYDAVIENYNEGTDLIQSSVSYTLAANVENLTLTGSTAIDGTGNELDNVLTGNSAANSLSGDAGNDTINGGAGDDYIQGDYDIAGNDYLNGGAGDDTIIGAGGADTIYGGAGNDQLHGDASNVALADQGDDYIDGGTGDNLIVGYGGNDTLIAADGNDTIFGGIGDDYIDGGDGENNLYGEAGNDVIFGGKDNDYIEGDGIDDIAGNDYLNGGAGDDTIIGAGGADTIYGGAGNDQLHGDASNVALADQGDDYIDGGSGDNLIVGYGGNDTLIAGEGNDTIYGDEGDDYIDAGDGNNTIYGGAGNNKIYAGSGNDYIEGGSGNNYINAGDGNNTLFGGAGNNEIYAGIGDDQIVGGDGNDYIDAGDGNNIVESQAGNDIIYAGTGNDQIWGGAGADTIYGGDGNDAIYTDDGNAGDGADFADGGMGDDTVVGGSGNDTLYGGAGNDFLEGDNGLLGTGNDYLDGGAGEDTILGEAGDDAIYGGADNDYLQGDKGNDTYIFGRGDGSDTIENYADDYATTTDTVQFGAGITSADLRLGRDANDLQINIKGTTDWLTIWDWFSGDAYKPDQFAFADGTMMTAEQIGALGINTIIYGTPGDDYIVGSDGNDIIIGGTGDDTLIGGAGDDTYIFNLGDGSKTIYDLASDTEGNTLLFGPGITPDDLHLTLDSLDIQIGNNGDIIHFNDFDPSDVYGTHDVDRYEFADGTVLSYSELLDRGIDITGTSGDDYIHDTSASDRIMALGGDDFIAYSSGNDTIDGGAGNDTLFGYGGGTYTYIFGRGDGSDVINNYLGGDWGPTTGIVQFGAAITPADLELTQDGNNMRISISGTSDSLTIENWFRGDAYRPEQFVFADSTVMTAEQLVLLNANIVYGTSGDDYIQGTAGVDIMIGGAGDDTYVVDNGDDVVTENANEGTDTVSSSVSYALPDNVENLTLTGDQPIDGFGNELNNTITGNDSGNYLSGGDGDDKLYGGAGSDYIDGGTGNDTIYGGAGDDYLSGGDGDDTYIFNSGDGSKTIYDLASGTEGNTLVFGPGITPDDLKLQLGDQGLDILIGSNGDVIHFDNSDYSYDFINPYGKHTVDTYEFADGTVLSYNELIDLGRERGIRGFTITGTSGNDYISDGYTGTSAHRFSTFGNDSIYGGAGYDIIYGGDGDDYINGGADGDNIHGGAGNDTLDSGADATSGADLRSSDVMYGGPGDDTYIVDNYYDMAFESYNEGVDTVMSSVTYSLDYNVYGYLLEGHYTAIENLILTGSASINGTGNQLDNVLTGNSGNNILEGLDGSDTYNFGRGGGVDTIINCVTAYNGRSDYLTSTDTIAFGEGIAIADLQLIKQDNDLRINIKGTTDSLIVKDWFYAEAFKVDQVSFMDGTLLSAAQLEAIGYQVQDTTTSIYGTANNDVLAGTSGNNQIFGNAGNDTLYGNAGEDTLDGGAGNDILEGDAGNDTYRFGMGSGMDMIKDYAGDYASTLDTLEFGAGIGPGDLKIFAEGLDLRIELPGGEDSILIENWASTGGSIDWFKFADGTELPPDRVAAIAYAYGTGSSESLSSQGLGDTQINGYGGDDTLIGGAGDDTLDGGAGDDYLDGGNGNDTYKFGIGSGVDTINNARGHFLIDGDYVYSDSYGHYESAATTDTVEFGAGITVNDLELSDVVYAMADESSLRINIKGTSDSLIINEWFRSDWDSEWNFKVDQFKFADGTVLTAAQLEALGFTLYGSPGNDSLDLNIGGLGGRAFGAAGDDTINGSFKSDTLDGGAGNDTLWGFGGGDTYIFGVGSGKDTILLSQSYYGQELNYNVKDTISFGPGVTTDNLAAVKQNNDLIINIEGTSDSLKIEDWFGGHDQVYQFQFADNTLMSAREMEALWSYAGDNLLYGGNGDDTLEGGAGNDYLEGGAGNDTYKFGIGSGEDTIGNWASDSISTTDTVEFGAGITANDLELVREQHYYNESTYAGTRSSDNLWINIQGTSDSLIIDNWFDGYAFEQYYVDQFQFADGTVLTAEQIYALSYNNITITGGTYTYNGSVDNDQINGSAGDDYLYGYEGDDTLDGGAGNDTLEGGGGNDTYKFNIGSGVDTISNFYNDPLTTDTVVFGQGITLDNIELFIIGGSYYSDSSLQINIKGTTDSLIIEDYFGAYNSYSDDYNYNSDYKVDQFQFADGTILTADQLEALGCTAYGSAANDNTGDYNYPHTFTTGSIGPDMIFGYAGNDRLNGNAGDDTLDGGTGNDTICGGQGNDTYIFGVGSGVDTINNSASDNVSTTDTVKFGAGITVNDLELVRDNGYPNSLRINIKGTSDSLIINNWFAGDAAKVGQFKFADGTLLTAAQLEARGCMVYGSQGDDPGLYGSIGNDTMYGYAGDDTYNFGRGSGVDKIYNYAADYATATDMVLFGSGISTADLKLVKYNDELRINIDNSTDSLVVNPIADQTATKDTAFAFTVPDNAFADIAVGDILKIEDWFKGDAYKVDEFQFNNGTILTAAQLEAMGYKNATLTYSATLADGTALPSWLTFDPATMTFSGTPTNDNVGTLSLKVTATEISGASVSNNFNVTVNNVANVNNPPIIVNPIMNQSTPEDALFNFTVPGNTFKDIDVGDTLTYSATLADGTALPPWLTFNAATMTFSGTPTNDNVGTLSLKVTATDIAGAGVASDFNVTVENVNDPPFVVNPLADQSTQEDALFTFTVPANTFKDIDVGDTLTYSATLADGTVLPSWLTFNAATLTFSGTPTNDNVGILPLKVTATDMAGASVASDFNVTVENVNDPPIVANPIANQSTLEDELFTFTVPGNTFADVDVGDNLTYSATLADGTALPSWLTFNTATMTFSGTPTNDDVGMLPLKVTVTDTAGASVSDDFNLTVINVNDPPFVVNPLADQSTQEDALFTFTVPANTFKDIDVGDILTYSATLADGTALPSWLTFNTATMTFSGTPTNDNVGTLSLKVTATDIAGASASSTFNLDVQTSVIMGTANNDNLVGTIHNDIIYGLGGNDTLTGGAGNDTLDGGAGADSMIGGSGNDTYVVDILSSCHSNTGDVVIENASEGIDTVQSSVTYTLGANVENLTLTGTAAINGTGNTLNNVLIGNSAVNTLTGGAGNDTLDGGAGADKLIGGAGNDTYIVDNTGDVITENACAGTDTVQSSVTYTLNSNVENLTLTGTAAINGTGNTSNNVLTGNSANNTLNGGTGADTMIGGAGNDIYVVDNLSSCHSNTGDVVIENANEGTDTVLSSVTYTLGNNVENLTLTGTSAINGTGNALDNYLTGNSGKNKLTGGAGNDTLNGGANADTMIGGLGDDTYIRDNTGDVITENANEGTDTVQSSLTYTLGSNVENLTLTGKSAINGTGNTLNNALIGNSAVNTLTGGAGNDILDGGAGNDILTGGNGSDTYLFRRTDGQDTLNETAGVSGDTDTLKLTDGITTTEPVLVKQNNDLYVFINANNYMKIAGEFQQTNYGIERLEVTDGHYITRADIQTIVDTMSAINNDSGMDVMQKYTAMMNDQQYQNILAQSWQQG